VHLSGIGHPILGDSQYGRSFICHYHPQRILLHSSEMIFWHPKIQKMVTIKAPIPIDFQNASKVLWGEYE
jgi:23S rRNA-/tRNA-specific pseudouridylate synthase